MDASLHQLRRVGDILLAVAAVDPEGDWAVVGEGDFHIRSENAFGYCFAEFFGEAFAEGFVERFGNVRVGGFKERGAVALFRGSMKGELADDEDVSAGVEDRAIHFAFIIAENAEAGDLSRQPFDVGRVIYCFDAEEDEETVGDRGVEGAFDFH
jgi:hypothetical protein